MSRFTTYHHDILYRVNNMPMESLIKLQIHVIIDTVTVQPAFKPVSTTGPELSYRHYSASAHILIRFDYDKLTHARMQTHFQKSIRSAARGDQIWQFPYQKI